MNEKDLVTFEQAKRLKELGFDWKTDYVYTKEKYDIYDRDIESIEKGELISRNSRFCIVPYCINAPFLYQVQNWLREEKNIHITIDTYYPNWQKDDHSVLQYECSIVNDIYNKALRYEVGRFDSYHEALSAAIDYGLQKVVC